MNPNRLLPLGALSLCLGILAPEGAMALEVSAVCTSSVGLYDDISNRIVDESYGPGSARCSNSILDARGAASAHGQAQAYAAAGVLRAYGSGLADANLGWSPAERNARAGASGRAEVRVVDRFQMSSSQVSPGSPLSVTLGFYAFGAVDTLGLGLRAGSRSANNYSVTFVQGNAVRGNSWGAQVVEHRSDVGDPLRREESSDGYFTGLHWTTINVLEGSSVDLIIQLDALAYSVARAHTDQPLGSSWLVADMGHSVTWAGISAVRDASGNLLSDYSALSASSGFDYANAYVTDVPEPSMLALLLTGLGWVPLWRRRGMRAERS